MQLLKPTWVNHDGDKAIFSVDIHPDGTRFATGGQGQDSSGRVVIWNLSPIISEKIEKDDKVPKLLCQLDQHLGCVNCVRWSKSGKYLASAGDDKAIIIWKQSSYGGGSVFGSNVVNVESWRIVSTLRGHEGDVLDVAWSPGDVWLASASIDNSVIIWNTEKWPEQIHVLRGHTGLVKGVAWDPIGRFIASQADDKTMRIWKTSSWITEHKVVEPFVECGGTTSLLRPSWSPDGQYLVSAHAMNNGGPTAQIIERDGWNTDKDFVGHRKAITCVRFNPNILKKQDRGTKPVQYCCVAIGSRDRALSIWFTSLKRPLVVIHDLFEDTVLDLTWSSCGRYLMAVSKDGTLAFVHFAEKDVGNPLTKEEMNAVHVKLYGNSAVACVAETAIIENPELLKIQNEDKPTEPQPEKKSITKAKIPNGPTNKQIEVKTADGRRRITPMFIPPPADGDHNSLSAPGSFSSSRQEKSKIVVEKRDGVVQPNVSSPTKSQSRDGLNGATSSSVPSGLESVPAILSARIEGGDNHSSAQLGSDKIEVNIVTNVEKPAMPIAMKRKADDMMQSSKKKRGRGRPPVFDKMEQASLPPSRPISPTSLLAKSNVPSPTKNICKTVEAKAVNRHILPSSILPHTSKIQIPEIDNASLDSRPVIIVENGWKQSDKSQLLAPSLHRVSRHENGTDSWSTYIPSPVNSYVCTQDKTVLACSDFSLHILTNRCGSYVFPPIQLSGCPSLIEFQKGLLIIVTTDAILTLWNLETGCRILSESISHLVENKGGVKSIQITIFENGDCQPVIVLYSGEVFQWNRNMHAWMQIGEGVSIRKYVSPEFATVPDSLHKQESLSAVLRRSATYSSSLKFTNGIAVSADVKRGLTEGFLQRMMASAELMKSKGDFSFWLKKFVRFYVSEGFEKQLRNLFDSLLHPVQESSNWWNTYLVDLNKKKLLEEFLRELLIAENSIKFQRMHAEYAEQLREMDRDSI